MVGPGAGRAWRARERPRVPEGHAEAPSPVVRPLDGEGGLPQALDHGRLVIFRYRPTLPTEACAACSEANERAAWTSERVGSKVAPVSLGISIACRNFIWP
jgi:hypothetical protein